MKKTLLALAIASISFAALADPPTDKPPMTTGVADEDIILQSYDVQAHVATEATTTCTVNAEIYDASDEFIAALGRVVALPSRDAALSVELPNVFVVDDLGMYVEPSINAPADGLCFVDAQLRGLKVP